MPLISDIQLLPSSVAPSGNGDWAKAPLSLRDGVVRAKPLFLWYRKDRTLQDVSEDERRSLITELDVVYGDSDPWYGFERLSPPTTERSTRSESVSITIRRGVKRGSLCLEFLEYALCPPDLTFSAATRSSSTFLA